ncbi:uncharacterized protein SPSK_06777 [Sporothrix schenckii 1099-18]|uniref:Uncharacterized protein n=1 Tax=Sporothrix schenckii 1099-18 TaxID=1397361 RepID=A0A0F2MMZ2_SPOSC|nr:uncharacterized protein SPSK_06777 [Sporothrix schenckii 1099-18]KJR89541.1 hypothetical protein SPSK_06777 [Sporothrix schenckii 1099-18]
MFCLSGCQNRVGLLQGYPTCQSMLAFQQHARLYGRKGIRLVDLPQEILDDTVGIVAWTCVLLFRGNFRTKKDGQDLDYGRWQGYGMFDGAPGWSLR